MWRHPIPGLPQAWHVPCACGKDSEMVDGPSPKRRAALTQALPCWCHDLARPRTSSHSTGFGPFGAPARRVARRARGMRVWGSGPGRTRTSDQRIMSPLDRRPKGAMDGRPWVNHECTLGSFMSVYSRFLARRCTNSGELATDTGWRRRPRPLRRRTLPNHGAHGATFALPPRGRGQLGFEGIPEINALTPTAIVPRAILTHVASATKMIVAAIDTSVKPMAPTLVRLGR
jgi:hypothetical protein